MGKRSTIKKDFKLTSLGPIPKEWEVYHFEDIADIDKNTLSGSTKKDYRFKYISLSDIDSEEFKIETTDQVFSTAPSRARRIVKKGDILMSNVRPNLQGFSIIRDDVKNLIASTGFSVITTKKGYNNEFVFQSLFGAHISRQLYQLLVGSNYPAISSSDVRKLKLPFPKFNEQIQIANILSLWDKSIATTTQLIIYKEDSQKWLMQQLLTGQKRLKGFNDSWVTYEISELFQPVYRYVEWSDSDLYKLVSVRRRFGGLFFRGDLLGEQIGVKKLKSIHTGDFLISKRQVSHGAWTVVPKEFNKAKVSDEYDSLKIKDNRKLKNNFWRWFCQTRKMVHFAYLDSTGVHFEKMIFDYDMFKKRKVKIPSSIVEQEAISNILDVSEQELHLLRVKAKNLREQKTGLMQVLLTGQKRVEI
ncbi:MAG: restriction endonuclease subunit S [Cyclobacteriaceae bacterium]|nr:restriction endonuclease subunit S [Cyclobacteriaceae bacterium]